MAYIRSLTVYTAWIWSSLHLQMSQSHASAWWPRDLLSITKYNITLFEYLQLLMVLGTFSLHTHIWKWLMISDLEAPIPHGVLFMIARVWWLGVASPYCPSRKQHYLLHNVFHQFSGYFSYIFHPYTVIIKWSVSSNFQYIHGIWHILFSVLLWCLHKVTTGSTMVDTPNRSINHIEPCGYCIKVTTGLLHKSNHRVHNGWYS